MKALLYILSLPFYIVYLGIMVLRNLFYDIGIFKVHKVSTKIISIGNLSAGGTGKTPFVISLAKHLSKKYKFAILSRGYGRRTTGTIVVTDGYDIFEGWQDVGDEPYLIAKNLKGVPVLVDNDKVRGARLLKEKFAPDVIILDDGFQHRRLFRNLDIVLVDSSRTRFFSYFREPFRNIKRASIIILTKTDNERSRKPLDQLKSTYPDRVFGSKLIVKNHIVDHLGNTKNINELKNEPVIIFSGIGNSKAFETTVKSLGCKILSSINFKDHHQYTESDLKRIKSEFSSLKPVFILTTEKDLLKLPESDLPIYSVPIMLNPESLAIKQIEKYLQK